MSKRKEQGQLKPMDKELREKREDRNQRRDREGKLRRKFKKVPGETNT